MNSIQNRYTLYLFISALCVFAGYLVGFLVCKQYYGDLEARLQFVEKQVTTNLMPGQEIKMDEVKILITKTVEEVKEQYELAIKLGLPLTIAALLASIFGAYRWASEIAKEEAQLAFKDPETLLKENKKILVLTPDGESVDFLYSFFQLMGFKTPTYKTVSEIDSVKSQHFDLAILNVPNDEVRKISTQNSLIEKISMAKSVLYFGLGQVSNTRLEEEGRLSFANAKSQLYGNLVNALKFQKML